MLGTLRENSRNVLIYVIFGIIIAAFILSFGPGSRGVGAQVDQSSTAATVANSTISEQDFRFAYIATGLVNVPPQSAKAQRLKEQLMDAVIERELLAQEAERLGFAVSQEQAEDLIADGKMMILGMPRPLDAYAYRDGKLDYEKFKQLAQNQFGISVRRFIELQQRELLAEKARELLHAGVKVSPDEVKSDFVNKGRQTNLEYVRFVARPSDDDSEPTDKEIDDYVKAHGDELKKQYEEQSYRFKQVGKQAKMRRIVIDVSTEEKIVRKPGDDKAADEAAIKAEAAKIAAMKDPAAKAKEEAKWAAGKKSADEAMAKLKAGVPFADVAKLYATDVRAKKRGGMLGWRRKEFTGVSKALEDKVFAPTAKKGEVYGPERTDHGYEIVVAEDYREGDIPLDVAKRELAEAEVLKDRGRMKAKAEAEALVAKLNKGEKLENLVSKDSADDKKSQTGASEGPKLKETGLFARHGDMVQDIGISKELSHKAFDLKPGEVAGPFDVGTGFVVVRAKDHKEPDMADFDKRKDELSREFEQRKWAQLVEAWGKERCVEARDRNAITVNNEMVSYEQVGKVAAAMTYQPCSGAR